MSKLKVTNMQKKSRKKSVNRYLKLIVKPANQPTSTRALKNETEQSEPTSTGSKVDSILNRIEGPCEGGACAVMGDFKDWKEAYKQWLRSNQTPICDRRES
jgi:hypothetical protein